MDGSIFNPKFEVALFFICKMEELVSEDGFYILELPYVCKMDKMNNPAVASTTGSPSL